MRIRTSLLSLVLLLLCLPSLLLAQNQASLAGVITDSAGAVVPGVNITLINTATSVSFQATSNSVGAYSFENVPPGPGYQATFSLTGFDSFVVTGMYLNVSNTRTQNVILKIGNVSQSVQVSAAGQGVTLDTTDATIGNNFEVQMVNQLPVQIRDTPSALFNIQPGVSVDASGESAVTGARTDQSHVTLDGLDVDDRATGQFGIVTANAPVDSVQEFRGVTAGATANFDSGGGGQFQLVTKSGTNHFHGSLFEYHRDTSTEANNWFNNNIGVPRPKLIRNQFGGNVGGPILKDKLFFFFEYNGRRDNQGVSVDQAVPTASYLAGNISYINNGSGCTSSSTILTAPQCISTYSASQARTLDPLGIGQNAALKQFVSQRYPAGNDPTGGDGINTTGFRFNAPVILKENNYVFRFDYNLTQSQKVFGRFSLLSQRQGDFFNYVAPIQFPGDPTTRSVDDASWAWVVGHNWAIGATKTNQIIYGETRSRLGFPSLYNPTGAIYYATGSGQGNAPSAFGPLAAPYLGNYNAQDRVIPVPMLRDDFTWQKGTHTLQFGGTFKYIKPTGHNFLNDFTPTLGIGGALSQLDPTLRPANILNDGSTATNNWDNAFAFDLGRFAQLGATYNYNTDGTTVPAGAGSVRTYRYYETEIYFGDTWKLTPSFTVSYGLRYQLYTVPYEVNGLEAIQVDPTTGKPFAFDKYFQARRQQSAAGISGNTAVPFLQYVLGGKANHGSPAGYYQPSYKDFAPRVAFSWNPSFDRKSVFNGGAGIVYDHTIVSAVQNFQDHSSYLFQADSNNLYGDSANPAGSLATDPRFTSINVIPTPPVNPGFSSKTIPFVDANGVPFGLPGNAFSTAIDPGLRTPYSIALNFGFQHEFGAGFILKTSYAGRLGRRLLAQVDASQIVDFPSGGQAYSTAFGNITKELRAGADPTTLAAEPWFETAVIPGLGQANGFGNNTQLVASFLTNLAFNGDFADFTQALSTLGGGIIQPNVGMASQFASNDYYTNKGFSGYNGLLVTLHKNYSHGLQFDLNYTWSHSIDNFSLVGNGQSNFTGEFICDATRPRECRGSSDFDETNVFNGDFIYDLPLGQGKSLAGNAPRWLDEAIGGWQVSGLPNFQTGTPYHANSTAYLASYANLAPAILVGQRSLLDSHVHKDQSTGNVYGYSNVEAAQNAFTGPVGLEIGSRNNLRGPHFTNIDLGLGKTFPIVENTRLVFRADAFNALNHPSFNLPNATIVSGSFGRVTSTASRARVLQLALRFEF